MLGSYGDLGACGKISASTVFDPIIDIMVLKYLKSLVTCHSLFKQTSKKEDPSSCFTSCAPLENPNTCNSLQDTVSVVMSDFEFHSPSALLHLVLLSGLEAIRKILGVGELSHFYKPSYCCVPWLVCIYVLFRISSLITHRTISSGSHWIKLTTWLKSDDGYQPISAVWFEIRRLLLFHGINKGQETSMENKRIRFTEASDGETKCWLTIQHKETRKDP